MPATENDGLDVDFTVSGSSSSVDVDRIAALLSHAASKESIRGKVGIWLCTDDEIADLHIRFMNVPGATDVITFPDTEPGPDEHLGDIAVSLDTATAQALDAGHDMAREVAYLCLHGLLHLAGYDDLDDRSRSVMLRRQEALLNDFEREYPGPWSKPALC